MTQRLKMRMLLVLSLSFIMFGAAQAEIMPANSQIKENPGIFADFDKTLLSLLPYSNQSFTSIFGNAVSSTAVATYTVDTTADNAALTACTDAPSDCSLRGAVSSAPAGTTINFSVSGTITLTSGEIGIAKDLTIIGPASAPGITISGNNASRIFTITTGTVNLSTLTLSGGNGRSVIVGSNSGGAVYNSGGTLTIANSTLSGNTVSNSGGGVYNKSNLTVANCTFSGNAGGSTYTGGGIYSFSGDINNNNSTLTIANSTFSDNRAGSTSNGGGIYSFGALDISNSIVAGNTGSSDLFSYLAPTGDYNLVQKAAGKTLSANNNITGQPALLGELTTANGGPTATMALLEGSFAINSGDPNFDTAFNPYDQRGAGFPRKNGSAIDIGAFESAFTNRPPVATNSTLYFYLNTASSNKLTASSGNPNDTLTYSIVTGTLPNGLILDTATGIISGTTTAYSTGTITFKATDGNGVQSNTATATINVVETPSLIVNTTSDTTANDEVTSLREAVAYAQSGSAGANPVVTFSVSGAIEVKEPTISISRDMTITGPGAGILAISGNSNDGVNYHATSIFSIGGGIVGISGLTLRDGTGTNITAYDPSTGANTTKSYGGAIYMSGGTVTVSDSTLSSNFADYGGAIYTKGGSLAVTNSTISNNNITAYKYGGGIFIDGGSVTMTSTTVSGNTAGVGAGILINNGTLNVSSSTISGNTAQNYTTTVTIRCATYEQCLNPPAGFTCNMGTQTCTGIQSNNGRGAGIYNSSGTVTLTNSTISGNAAQGYDTFVGNYGGGIDNHSAIIIASSTITNNSGLYGGGILNRGTINLSNTIIAGNRASYDKPDIFNYPSTTGSAGGTASGSYNLVQNGGTITGTNNITGQDPKLAALANIGGATKTHATLAGSPALDAGDPNFDAAALPYDQRGAGFPRIKNGRIDMGAYESEQNQSGSGFVVNTLTDHDDGICGATDCTLREAVKYAPDGTAITFGVNGTITLTGGDLVVTKTLTVTGPASAPGITVSGNNASRIFTVALVSGLRGSLNLSNLTLTGGNGGGGGQNSGNGGAIAVDPNTSAVVSNSTFTGNKATTATTNNGGAIRNGGTLTVTNSTFSDNTAAVSGGAIHNNGTLTVTNSTFAGNTATTGKGGGININTSTTPTNLFNSILAGNTAATSPDIFGTVAAGDYNLVQNATGATLAGTHNITGQEALLGALADNGGVTKTMALLANSPAINAGDPNFDATATPYDQRGAGFARKVGSAIDIGAFEIQPVAAPTDLTITKTHTGNFTQGETGKTYSIVVANSGGTASSGTVSVTDTLPAGLTPTAISGTGWTCTLSNPTCTRSDALAANASYPTIILTVNVASDAPVSVTNTASVSGGGETNTANNTANDPTTISPAPATYSISGQITNGGEGLSGVTVTLAGSLTASTTTNASGNYSFANLSGGNFTITPSLSGYTFVQPSITLSNLSSNQANANFATSVATYEGDVAARPTGDGAVDILDVIAVGNIIANLPGVAAAAAGGEFQRADAAPRSTKGDGSIDIQDLIQMQLYAAALNALTPASGAANAIVPPPSPSESLDFDKFSNDAFTDSPNAGSATISAGTATASNGTAIVPIQLNSNNVGGVQFTVNYDPAKLSIPSLASITSRAVNVSFTFNNSTPGQLGVVAFQSTAGDVFPASTLLFNINFTVAGGATPGTTPISFGNTPVPVKASDPTANAATATTTPGAVTILGPTAASVSIEGQVKTAAGRGIKNVLISLTDPNGNVRTTRTTAFGNYRFDDVAAGATYIITAKAKLYEFSLPTQVINVNEATFNVDFTANPQ